KRLRCDSSSLERLEPEFARHIAPTLPAGSIRKSVRGSDRRFPIPPGHPVLECRADRQHGRVVEAPADNLQACWQAFAGGSGGDAQNRTLRDEVEHCRHIEAMIPAVSIGVAKILIGAAYRRRRYRYGRAEQRIVGG